MKSHTVKGAAILEPIPALAPVIPIVRHHHERWDGQGYPDGLSMDKISLLARIVADIPDQREPRAVARAARDGFPRRRLVAEGAEKVVLPWLREGASDGGSVHSE